MPKLVKRGAAPTRPPEPAPAKTPATHALGHAVYHPVEGVTIHHADSSNVLKVFQDESVDAVVCDPPYGLSSVPDAAEVLRHWLNGDDYEHKGSGFMGKTWDSFVPGPVLWQEVYRVLKPGGYAFVFAGTRTLDLMGMSLRLAGFEPRDVLAYMFGSGFPKGLNVSKAIDTHLGAERTRIEYARKPGMAKSWDTGSGKGWSGTSAVDDNPATPQAAAWDGWNTQLKPAYEPIILVRKPTVGSVAENVLEHGTGALNIDGCRVGTTGTVTEEFVPPKVSTGSGRYNFNTQPKGEVVGNGYTRQRVDGRWPANVLHDGSDEVLETFAMFGESTTRPSDGSQPSPTNTIGLGINNVPRSGTLLNDSGTAARFFYTAKASSSERGEFNSHGTVKPVDLMRWLVRLVCRRGGVVLDPFLGSGTTAVACVEEGMRCIGIEREEEYVKIALARLHRQQGPSAMVSPASERVEL